MERFPHRLIYEIRVGRCIRNIKVDAIPLLPRPRFVTLDEVGEFKVVVVIRWPFEFVNPALAIGSDLFGEKFPYRRQ